MAPSQLLIEDATADILKCPACKGDLRLLDGAFICLNDQCGINFPVVSGTPIMINEKNSLFSLNDFISRKDTYFKISENSRLKNLLRRCRPSISRNIASEKNYKRFAQKLLSVTKNPHILVIGGSILGNGLSELLKYPEIRLTETDVSFGPRTMVICDAHDIPFADGSFDGVIIQAVLEHVVDPSRCVSECHRILKSGGLIYSETPFMQQVHSGAYDFTRFTHLGHRRLFRQFAEVDSGLVCGPGMALAWSCQYFLMSFSESHTIRKLLQLLARFSGFWLKYFDPFLAKKAGSIDAASGCYFIGSKSDSTLSDKELLKLYRGLC